MRNKHWTIYGSFMLLVFLSAFFEARAQNEIPIGSWRMHISYRHALSLADAGPKIFCAVPNGVFSFSSVDNSIETLTKLEGLSDNNIATLGYSVAVDALIVGYVNGNIDILSGNEITNYPVIQDSGLPDKTINHILFNSKFAYISTDFGVLVLDLDQFEAVASYLNLGINGEVLKINQAGIFNDSLFLATGEGVIAGSLDPKINLPDFNNWFRFDSSLGIPATNVDGIAAFNGKLYAIISKDGIYNYANGTWVKQDTLQNTVIRNIHSNSRHLTVTTDSEIWSLSGTDFTKISSTALSDPQMALFDESDNIWIADKKQGLVTNFGGNFNTIIPSGPFSDHFFKLYWDGDRILGLPGGYYISGNPENNSGFYYFQKGVWNNFSMDSYDIPKDLVDIVFDDTNDTYFVASFGGGFLTWDGADGFLTSNTQTSGYPFITDLLSAVSKTDKLWVSLYDTNPSLYGRDDTGTWMPADLDQLPSSEQIVEIVPDQGSNLWLRIDPSGPGGLIVYNDQRQETKRITTESGSGGLPNLRVNDLELDLDGNMWVATDEGVGYFPAGSFDFNFPIDVVKPILDGRFLLKNEKVKVIETDGGNRKWIGTENGLWLFAPLGDELIMHFSTENSPLLSDKIIDIEMDDETGEVFIATESGLVSFRSDATSGEPIHSSSIKVFPNPITSDFNGTVGIAGLANDAEVKITDVSGNLVWKMRSNGGTASWNLSTLQGGRPSSGIYLIFSSTTDGGDTFVGKLAVIE